MKFFGDGKKDYNENAKAKTAQMRKEAFYEYQNKGSADQQTGRRLGIGGTRNFGAGRWAGSREGGGMRHLPQRCARQRGSVARDSVSASAGSRSGGTRRRGRQRGHAMEERSARRRRLAWRT